MLLLLHSAFILSVVKMMLKGEVGGCALNGHGNYIVDHGKSWKNHGIVFLNFCGNPVTSDICLASHLVHLYQNQSSAFVVKYFHFLFSYFKVSKLSSIRLKAWIEVFTSDVFSLSSAISIFMTFKPLETVVTSSRTLATPFKSSLETLRRSTS